MSIWRSSTGLTLVLLLIIGTTGCIASRRAIRIHALRQPKVLNNFVTELLQARFEGARGTQGFKFHNPRGGWVFFRFEVQSEEGAEVALHLAGSTPLATEILAQDECGEHKTIEVMRYLRKGKHRVYFVPKTEGGRLYAITVRTMPEILYANYPHTPFVTEYGTYDWDYLKKIGMLDNINTIVALGDPAPAGDFVDEWTAQGKRILHRVSMMHKHHKTLTPGEVLTYWTGRGGMKDPRLSGCIASEVYPGMENAYGVWAVALNRLLDDHPDRYFYPYIALDAKRLIGFVRPLVRDRCIFAYERYLHEQPTEAQAKKFIEKSLKEELLTFEEHAPGATEHMLFAMGFLCAPPETVNVNPATDFKVFLDMQFHLIATDPAFKGLRGVEEYSARYADEEYQRWAIKLFRHYCIEGKAERLTDDPYELNHIANPDFEKGLEGWTVSAAETGSVAVKKTEKLGWLQGRFPNVPNGDVFLWTKRNAQKPNVVSQQIRNLEPGRVYSLKMYAADYGELTREQRLNVSVAIGGVEMIPQQSFQAVFHNHHTHRSKQFPTDFVYFNWYRLVFRAKSDTAKLTISDWANNPSTSSGQADPGGPAGQELLYNFIEIEPFLMPDA